MRTTLHDIYKSYKHGENYKAYGFDKVYKALGQYGGLQVVVVYGYNKDNLYTRKLYNYIPEDNKFILIMEE